MASRLSRRSKDRSPRRSRRVPARIPRARSHADSRRHSTDRRQRCSLDAAAAGATRVLIASANHPVTVVKRRRLCACAGTRRWRQRESGDAGEAADVSRSTATSIMRGGAFRSFLRCTVICAGRKTRAAVEPQLRVRIRRRVPAKEVPSGKGVTMAKREDRCAPDCEAVSRYIGRVDPCRRRNSLHQSRDGGGG